MSKRSIFVMIFGWFCLQPGLGYSTSQNKSPRVVKYRLPISLTEFKKVAVKDQSGVIKQAYRPAPSMQFRLRARIDIVNHFYIKGWHFETIPLKWEKSSRNYQLKIRFYRQYGINKSLEEMVGTMEVKGKLKGSGDVLAFEGFGQKKFFSKKQTPMAVVRVGPPPSTRKSVRVGRVKTDGIKVR